MGTVLIILIVLALLWPWILKWLRGFMALRAEDLLRKMTGQPTRRQERKMKRERQRADNTQSSRRQRRRHPATHPADELRKVAVDVEYTESVDYSETSVIDNGKTSSRREYHEQQVEDVKFTEIKDKTGKKE